MDKRKVIVLLGPTASGKTEISIPVAKYFNMEIISADSRQIFKNIGIASATPSAGEMQGIKHHFIGELEPDEEFNAGEYGISARKRIAEIFNGGKTPMVVGGSGLYLQSLMEGLFEGNSKNEKIREELNLLLEKKGKEYLYEELKKIDPERAALMSSGYHRRVIRALEVFYTTGKKISDLQKEKIETGLEFYNIGLLLEREYLYQRINQRVDSMLERGLVDEVNRLKQKGFHYTKNNSLNTVGVREIFDFLDGKISLEEAIELIKRNSRRYAKRQMTWFRKVQDVEWVKVIPGKNISDLIIRKIEKIFSE
jgi:tRNA dimethylallyltransferase